MFFKKSPLKIAQEALEEQQRELISATTSYEHALAVMRYREQAVEALRKRVEGFKEGETKATWAQFVPQTSATNVSEVPVPSAI